MLSYRFFLLVSTLFLHHNGTAYNHIDAIESDTMTMVIAVQDTVAAGFLKLSENTACHDISLPTDHGPQRSLVELLLICDAFHATGVKVDIELFVTPSYQRSLHSVEQGLADISSESIWLSDINEKRVYISHPIVQKREFEKGLYTAEHHPVLTQPEDEFNAQDYSGVTVRSWERDLQVLSTITPSYTAIHHYSKLSNVLSASRADFSLFAFSWGPEMTINNENVTLRPIPNVKVVMPGSRHFIMSNQRADALRKYELLEKGLTILKERGELKKFLFESGMKNMNTRNWKVLN